MKISSFRQMRNSQGNLQPSTDQCFLFTKLKQSKLEKKALTMPNSLQSSIETPQQQLNLFNDIKFKIQILKLQQANFVAKQHLKTGKSVKRILKSISPKLEEEIHKILNPEPEPKKEEHLQLSNKMHSTLPNTCSPSSDKIQMAKGKRLKIVQFTLGDMSSIRKSSAKSYLSKSIEGDQVSEFCIRPPTKQRVFKLK